MANEAAKPSRRAQERAAAKARAARRDERRHAFFDLLASGYSHQQIAESSGLSVSAVRREIDRALDERRLDAPERFLRLQAARLTKALRVADEALDRGKLGALRPFLEIVKGLDRYHGIDVLIERESAEARRLPPPEPAPLALAAPTKSEKSAQNGA